MKMLKDKSISIRMTSKTFAILETMAALTGKKRNDVIADALELLYSKRNEKE